MRPWRRRVDADIDQAIHNVGWTKPPALAACPRPAPGQGPGAGTAALPEHAVHQEATTHPPVASPGTGLDHGGLIRMILVYGDGRTEITRWPEDATEVLPGDCAECGEGTCSLCAFYTVWDAIRNRWVRRYTKCPAHAREHQP